MIEQPIIRRILRSLSLIPDDGLREDILLDEAVTALRQAGRFVESDAIIEHLNEAQRHGWVEKFLGVLDQPRWRIKPAGRNALKDLS